MIKHKMVLYNRCYGGFSLSESGRELIRSKFSIELEYDSVIRDNQDVIRFMLENGGLSAFQGMYSKLFIAIIRDDIPYEIEEYDGREDIRPKIPYEQIVKDLIQIIKSAEVDWKKYEGNFSHELTRNFLLNDEETIDFATDVDVL